MSKLDQRGLVEAKCVIYRQIFIYNGRMYQNFSMRVKEIVMLVRLRLSCILFSMLPTPVSQHYQILLATHCRLWTYQHLYICTFAVTLINW